MNLFAIVSPEYYFHVILLSVSLVMMVKNIWHRDWEWVGFWLIVGGFTWIGIQYSSTINAAGNFPVVGG